MASSRGNSNCFWYENHLLENDLIRYVQQNLKRNEIPDFMRRDYPFYAWSMPILDRRLPYFDIRYIDLKLGISAVTNAVRKELEGPGKLLGYRAMNQKLRTEHGICVPRHLVYDVMWDADPQAIEARNVNKKKRSQRSNSHQMDPTGLCLLMDMIK